MVCKQNSLEEPHPGFPLPTTAHAWRSRIPAHLPGVVDHGALPVAEDGSQPVQKDIVAAQQESTVASANLVGCGGRAKHWRACKAGRRATSHCDGGSCAVQATHAVMGPRTVKANGYTASKAFQLQTHRTAASCPAAALPTELAPDVDWPKQTGCSCNGGGGTSRRVVSGGRNECDTAVVPPVALKLQRSSQPASAYGPHLLTAAGCRCCCQHWLERQRPGSGWQQTC